MANLLDVQAAEALLKRKYHGIPGWLIAGAGVAVAIFVVPKLGGVFGASSRSSSDTSGGYTGTGSYGQGLNGPGGAPGPVPGTTTTSGSGAPGQPKSSGIPRTTSPPSHYTAPTHHASGHGHAGVKPKNQGSTAGSKNSGPGDSSNNGDFNPVNGRTSGNQALGGGRPTGSLSADLWEDHHPLHKRLVLFPHFVRVAGVGGPAAHAAQVGAIAARFGVHPARLLALNPYPRDVVRVA